MFPAPTSGSHARANEFRANGKAVKTRRGRAAVKELLSAL